MKKDINVEEYNRKAWDNEVERNSEWSRPVSADVIALSKKGKWQIHLTPKPLPQDWLSEVKGLNILCLAAAGGQQAPVLAAAGAKVTVFDNSPKQLEQDQMVAKRDGLTITTILGDMRDLSCFDNESFDIIIHPISNLYVPDLKLVWQEAYRVLKSKGLLLSSFYNPVVFIFDRNPIYREQNILKPKFKIPYSDLNDLSEEEIQKKISNNEALCFGHSLTEQIAGQIKAGFLIAGFYEDYHPHARFLIDEYMPSFIATKAVKL
jgi:SAM-dependent methyltransferase